VRLELGATTMPSGRNSRQRLRAGSGKRPCLSHQHVVRGDFKGDWLAPVISASARRCRRVRRPPCSMRFIVAHVMSGDRAGSISSFRRLFGVHDAAVEGH